MSQRDHFFSLCGDVTEFCLAHAGRCFGGWTRERIFLRIAGAATDGNLFVIRKNRSVMAIGIAKLTNKGLFIWEVIGSRAACREMLRRALRQWPNVQRFFAYRQDRLVEFNPETLRKFCGV